MKNWVLSVKQDFVDIIVGFRSKWYSRGGLIFFFFVLTCLELYSFKLAIDIALTETSLSGSMSGYVLDVKNPVAVYAKELKRVIDAETAKTGVSSRLTASEMRTYYAIAIVILVSFALLVGFLIAIEVTNKRKITALFANAKERFRLLDARFGLGIILLITSINFTKHHLAARYLNTKQPAAEIASPEPKK